MKKTPKLTFGLICVCLILLSACSNKPCPTIRPIAPPGILLQTIEEPQLKGNTNSDLVALVVELRSALRLANNDKTALQKWLEEATK